MRTNEQNQTANTSSMQLTHMNLQISPDNSYMMNIDHLGEFGTTSSEIKSIKKRLQRS